MLNLRQAIQDMDHHTIDVLCCMTPSFDISNEELTLCTGRIVPLVHACQRRTS
jgi:hypothetical protein